MMATLSLLQDVDSMDFWVCRFLISELGRETTDTVKGGHYSDFLSLLEERAYKLCSRTIAVYKIVCMTETL